VISAADSDIVNGVFEFVGAIMCVLHAMKLREDKQLRGVSWIPFAFFTSWGFWNLAFYPAVGCWLSFYASVFLVSVNSYYCYLMWLYRKN
jgi:hypothetical protein